MLEALVNAWRVPDLRQKIVFTFAMLVVFRFVAHVPVPGVDVTSLQRLFESNQLLGMLDLFSGGAMRNLSVAAMGVYPYITASIIMQLMVPVIPPLEALSKEGELGRRRINQYSRYLTIALSVVQGSAIASYLEQRSDRPTEAVRQVVWSLLTSTEFRFNH